MPLDCYAGNPTFRTNLREMRSQTTPLMLACLCATVAETSFAQWQVQAGVPSVDIFSIAPFDPNIINGGTLYGLLRSIDGGTNWDTTSIVYQGAQYPGTFYDTHFFSSQVGVATGLLSFGTQHVMLRTTNAGTDWSVAYFDNTGGLILAMNDIAFVSATAGLAVGTDNLVLRTTNAGMNWTPVTVPGSGHLYAAQYSSSLTCHAAGGSRILKSINGGINWSEQTFSGIDLRAMHFPTGSIGYATGKYGVLFKTTDSGQNWIQLANIPGNPDLTDVYFTSDQEGYATGETRIYHTNTGGAYWEWFECGSPMNALGFLGSSGFAAGNDGTILRTSANGQGYVPLASFAVNPIVNCVDSVISLTSSSSPAWDHAWYLNGELFSSEVSPTLVINEASQTDTITLVVTNGFQSAAASQTIAIANSLNVPINYNIVSDTICYGASTVVQVLGSVSGVAYSLHINGQVIGNTQTGNGGPLNFWTGVLNATVACNFEAVRTVPGCGTGTSTVGFGIFVRPSLQLATASPVAEVVCVGELLPIVISNSQPDVSYQLRIGTQNIGPPLTGNGGTITFSVGPFTTDTTYNVLATNSYGCSASLAQSIAVTIDRPEAYFTVPSYNPLAGTTWQVINTTGIPGASYSWSFGSGATPISSSDLDPSVSYGQTGPATITLTVTTPGGCTDQAEINMQVIALLDSTGCTATRIYQTGGDGFLTGTDFGPDNELGVLMFNANSYDLMIFGALADSVTDHPPYQVNGYQETDHLVKLDRYGVPQWMVRIWMEQSWFGGGDVVIDENGNFYAAIFIVAGFGEDSVRLYSTDGRSASLLATPTNPPTSLDKGVLASWDRNGILRWHSIFIGHYSDQSFTLKLNTDSTVMLLNGDRSLSSYSSNTGALQWSIPGNGTFMAGGLCTDTAGNSWIFRNDLLLEKYDYTGNLQTSTLCASEIPIAGANTGIGVFAAATDTAGYIYALCSFAGRWVIAGDTVYCDPTLLPRNDRFVVKIDPEQGAVWVRTINISEDYDVGACDGFAVIGDHVLWLTLSYLQTNYFLDGLPPFVSHKSTVLVHFDADGGTPRISDFPSSNGLDSMLFSGRWKDALAGSSDEQEIALVAPFGVPITYSGNTYAPINPGSSGNALITFGGIECFVTDLPSPTATPISYFISPTAPCPWQLFSFSDASLNDATEWSWDFPGATPSGSTDQDPEVMYMGPGIYPVTLTTWNGNGIGTTYSTSVTIDICTTASARASDLASVGPIPADEVINVHMNHFGSCTYSILDMQGRLLHSEPLNRSGTIGTAHFSNGTYVLKLAGPAIEEVIRFTVQH